MAESNDPVSGRRVSIDDEDLLPPSVEKYMGVDKKTDRIAILNPTSFAKEATHYVDGAGSFICFGKWKTGKSGPCEKFGDPRLYYVFTIIHYYTADDEGEKLDAEKLKQKKLGEVKFWKVGQDKMAEIKRLHKRFDLRTHDLIVTAKGTGKFQKLEILPHEKCFWIVNPQLKKIYEEKVEEVADQTTKLLGRRISDEAQLEAFLGRNAAQGREAAAPIRGASLADPEEINSILEGNLS